MLNYEQLIRVLDFEANQLANKVNNIAIKHQLADGTVVFPMRHCCVTEASL